MFKYSSFCILLSLYYYHCNHLTNSYIESNKKLDIEIKKYMMHQKEDMVRSKSKSTRKKRNKGKPKKSSKKNEENGAKINNSKKIQTEWK